jgi:hypothetical protein
MRLDNIDLPSIILTDIESYHDKPWRNPANRLSDYFNYGLTEEVWKKYCENLKAKYKDNIKALNEYKMTDNKIFNYLFNLPSDFGGIGEVQEDSKYENLNFFEYRTKNKQLPAIEIRQGVVCVPVESSHEQILHNPLNNNFPPNISPQINPMFWHGPFPFRPPFDMQMRPNMFYRPMHGEEFRMGGIPTMNGMPPINPYLKMNPVKKEDSSEKKKKKKSII